MLCRISSCLISPHFRAYKNVIGAALVQMLVFSNIVALSSLQSSLNNDEGIGLTSLIILCVALMIVSLFTSSIIHLLGTKYTLVLASFLSLVYAATNFYPRWYTLIPGGIIFGITETPIFASVNVHVTTLAIKYAPHLNEKSDHLIALFIGIVNMLFKLSSIPGNLATTIILFSERHSSGSEIIDTSLGDVCNNTEVDTLNTTYVYILMSTFVLLSIAAGLIALFFLDHLKTELEISSCRNFLNTFLKEPITATLNMFINWKYDMIIPMSFTDGFIVSSVVGKLSKYYVSDCIGVHWVGVFTMTFGLCSAVTSVIIGRLEKWMPQFVLVYFFSAQLLIVLLFLLFYDRVPSYLFAFIPIAIIGACEGLWNVVPPILVGILFPDNKAPAYSALRLIYGAGYGSGITVALLFHIQVTLWTLTTLAVTSLITYTILLIAKKKKGL